MMMNGVGWNVWAVNGMKTYLMNKIKIIVIMIVHVIVITKMRLLKCAGMNVKQNAHVVMKMNNVGINVFMVVLVQWMRRI